MVWSLLSCIPARATRQPAQLHPEGYFCEIEGMNQRQVHRWAFFSRTSYSILITISFACSAFGRGRIGNTQNKIHSWCALVPRGTRRESFPNRSKFHVEQIQQNPQMGAVSDRNTTELPHPSSTFLPKITKVFHRRAFQSPLAMLLCNISPTPSLARLSR